MTIPDTMAPARPLANIRISARANDAKRCPSEDIDEPGAVK